MNKKIKKSIIIAKYTFKEIVSGKILMVSPILGLSLLIITYIAYEFTYETTERVALDFGLGMLNLSSVGISLFIGSGILSNEIQNRTVYMIVSRPVSRLSFIIGKNLGLMSINIVNVFFLSILTLAIYFLIGGAYNSLILWSILFILLESTVVLLLVSTLSLFSSQVLAVLISICLYVLGHMSEAVKLTSMYKHNEMIAMVADYYHFILPSFGRFNIKQFVLYEQSLSTQYLLSTFSYGIVYSVFLLMASILVFKRKDLE